MTLDLPTLDEPMLIVLGLAMMVVLVVVAAHLADSHGDQRYNAGLRAGIKHQQDDAIKAGVGLWQCDPKTGDIVFRYVKDVVPTKENDA